jgi:hypothetical protein
MPDRDRGATINRAKRPKEYTMKKQTLFDALWKTERELEEATYADQDEIDEIRMRGQDLVDNLTRKGEMSFDCGVSYHQAPVVHIQVNWGESHEENLYVYAWCKHDGRIYVDIAADKGIDDETIEMVRQSIKEDLEQYVSKEQLVA